MLLRILSALTLTFLLALPAWAQMQFDPPPDLLQQQIPGFLTNDPPDLQQRPDIFTQDKIIDHWFIVPDESLQDKFRRLPQLCAACYPKPEVFPFPIPIPKPRPKLDLPFSQPQGSVAPSLGRTYQLNYVRLAGLGDPVATSALEAQIALARSITALQLCNAVLTRLLAVSANCDGDASFKTSTNEYIEVLSGGAPMPVFLIQVAAKSPRLAQHDVRAFESHRYYLAFILDFDLNMQVILFDYEPLYNLSGSITDVLNRNHFNTEYIETRSNEGIVTLSDKLRTVILETIVETAQNGAPQ